MLPRKLYNFNAFIDGRPMAGLVEEITLPKLDRKMEDYSAGGMIGSVALDLGLDKLSMDFTLAEFNIDVLRRWGCLDAAGVPLRFLGAARADDSAAAVEAIEISVRGRWKTLDKGNQKRGERTKMKVEMPLAYFKYSSNSQTIIEIDLINGIEVVDGVDLTAAVRAALGQN